MQTTHCDDLLPQLCPGGGNGQLMGELAHACKPGVCITCKAGVRWLVGSRCDVQASSLHCWFPPGFLLVPQLQGLPAVLKSGFGSAGAMA